MSDRPDVSTDAGKDPVPAPATDPSPARGGRRPIFSRFIVVGAVLGFALATGVALLLRPDAAAVSGVSQTATYGIGRVMMFFGVLGGGLGALVGALVSVLLDRRR